MAVAAVLAFHGGFGWASGGYLGVSVFFTLSGFLITRLLLAEHERTGRIDLVRFATRRARRLLPASCACVAAILLATQLGAFDEVANLRRDLFGAVSQLANWAQLTSGRSYAEIFAAGASPVEHFWSLAIEEQFYLVWPLAFALVWARRSPAVRLRLAVAAFALLAVVPAVVARVWSADAAYLSTPARLAELFAGVVLAMVLQHRQVPAWLAWVAPAALVVFVALTVLTPSGHGWAYQGGLPLFALLSAALVAGLQVDGPAQRLLARRPLVAVGAVSYGLYVFHWPIFLLADAHPLGLHGGPLFLAKCVASGSAAVISYWLLERPIRRRAPRPRTTFAPAFGAIAVLVLAAAAIAPGPAPALGHVEASTAEKARIEPLPAGAPGLGTGPVPARPVRILVVGDSTGEVMGAGLVEWAAAHPSLAQVDVEALPACGLVTGGHYLDFLDQYRKACDERLEALPGDYERLHPDVVVVVIAAADTWDRRWGDGPGLRPTDPTYRTHIEDGYRTFFDAAVDADVPHVVWLRPAQIGTEPKYADPSFGDGGQALVQRTVEAAVERHPGRVEVLDFRSWFEGTAYPHDQAIRPDGVHLIPEVAARVATDWFGPNLVRIALR
ncbi:acyltransferase [Aquihabitans sp. G128]|uniref:acyltransferase family protein n=1 Tax=Aquihabitans sp. G128 TaxID=2849779 RepID=UPI001C2271FF|nr:acyltransferase [Aquihabitans sp. G128]